MNRHVMFECKPTTILSGTQAEYYDEKFYVLLYISTLFEEWINLGRPRAYGSSILHLCRILEQLDIGESRCRVVNYSNLLLPVVDISTTRLLDDPQNSGKLCDQNSILLNTRWRTEAIQKIHSGHKSTTDIIRFEWNFLNGILNTAQWPDDRFLCDNTAFLLSVFFYEVLVWGHFINATRSRAVAIGWPTVLPDSVVDYLLSLNSISSCFRDNGPKRPSPFMVTWRHRSRDYSIPQTSFPVCFFRQFFGKTHRLATIHTLQTERQSTDTNTVSYKRDVSTVG